jgi:Protein of unknown function (DUF1501)
MKSEKQFRQYVERHPHPHQHGALRPFFSRRAFFQMGAGVTASVLAGRPAFGQEVVRHGGATINKAKNVIFMLLTGAPSHLDTFDFKTTVDTPMDLLKPQTVQGIVWPTGIMPKLANQIGDLAVARSVRSWALQHNLAQSWAQIGRSPAAALGDIAPNIGAIVAAEMEKERIPGQVFPTFLALNSGAAVGSGYLPASYSPLKITPAVGGLPDTRNTDGDARFASKYELMQKLDQPLRDAALSPHGPEMAGYEGFYQAGKAMMFNPDVDRAFRYTNAEAVRYGSSGFGNACLNAAKVLGGRGGTRYIMITLGGWDHHTAIYTALPPLAKQLDDGVSALIEDLKANGTYDETLIVIMGEFGRTPGALTATDGRDHHLQQFAVFAGAGVKGGRTLGSTDAAGQETREYGWSRDRDIRVEDIEATIYSALGIDWTTVRYDDPFGRGFYYVPESNNDLYGPIHELWS